MARRNQAQGSMLLPAFILHGPDTLKGTNAADNLLGKGANDVLFSLAGRDNLLGEES
jgi:Ca2+-binding RTX toxin-like protein